MSNNGGDQGGPRVLAAYSSLYQLAGGQGLDREALRAGVESVTIAVNTILDDSNDANEKVANLVFAASYGRDVAGALNPSRKTPPVYKELKKRAGASLDVEADALSVFLRIGALNAAGHGDAWNKMLWSKKVELLPLLKLANPRLFAQGIAFANRPRVGVRHVRTWVADEQKKAKGEPVAPTPEVDFTLSAGRKLVERAVPLANARARKSFAKQVNAAPRPERKRMKRDLEAMAKNILKLAAEIDDDDDE